MTDTMGVLPRKSDHHLLKHGHSMGKVETPTYKSWKNMKVRCNLPGRRFNSTYAAKGITYDPRWEQFEAFLADMGERPHGMTLDRIDNDKGYYAANCRWATSHQQARNTSKSILTLETATEVALLKLRGVKSPEIAGQFGICVSLPRQILNGNVWPDALALATAAYAKELENVPPPATSWMIAGREFHMGRVYAPSLATMRKSPRSVPRLFYGFRTPKDGKNARKREGKVYVMTEAGNLYEWWPVLKWAEWAGDEVQMNNKGEGS